MQETIEQQVGLELIEVQLPEVQEIAPLQEGLLVLIKIDRIEQVEALELLLVHIALQEVANTHETQHLVAVLTKEEQQLLEAQQDLHRQELHLIEAQVQEQIVALLHQEVHLLEAAVIDLQDQVQEAAVVAQEVLAAAALEAQVGLLDHLQEALDLRVEVQDLQVKEDNSFEFFRKGLKFKKR